MVGRANAQKYYFGVIRTRSEDGEGENRSYQYDQLFHGHFLKQMPGSLFYIFAYKACSQELTRVQYYGKNVFFLQSTLKTNSLQILHTGIDEIAIAVPMKGDVQLFRSR